MSLSVCVLQAWRTLVDHRPLMEQSHLPLLEQSPRMDRRPLMAHSPLEGRSPLQDRSPLMHRWFFGHRLDPSPIVCSNVKQFCGSLLGKIIMPNACSRILGLLNFFVWICVLKCSASRPQLKFNYHVILPRTSLRMSSFSHEFLMNCELVSRILFSNIVQLFGI